MVTCSFCGRTRTCRECEGCTWCGAPKTNAPPRKCRSKNGSEKLVILDLNGFLVHRVREVRAPTTSEAKLAKEGVREADAKLGNFYVWKRPHADAFVRWLARKGVRVGFWSTAMEHNVVKLIAWLLPHAKDRAKVSFVWDGRMCKDTGMRDPKNPHKPLVLKELKKIWHSVSMKDSNTRVPCTKSQATTRGVEKGAASSKDDKRRFGPHNTVLMDDSENKADANPPATSIHPPPWSIEDGDDNFLGRNGTFRKYVAELLKAKDTQRFIKERPFHMEELQRVQHMRIDSPPRSSDVEGGQPETNISSDSDSCEDEQQVGSRCLACFQRPIPTDGESSCQQNDQAILVHV
mmetsp:Transcript_10241/g.62568  ORF Transcript_10241/g.62568 Transcript_10241/m.62568 type:complete len:348 (-) Transcript_10241:1352-2395(-)